MEVKYYGHSSFSVHIGGKTILFDPFIRPNELAKNINVTEIKADYIFISHAHNDHIADALEIAGNSRAVIVGIFEVAEWYRKQGYNYTYAMNIGGYRKFDFGTVQMVKAVHSSTFPDGSNGGNPAGYVVSDGNKTFYYSGDTALTTDMQLIPLRHRIDFAFLPIGDNFTMDVTDAVVAADFVKCRHVIGMHYDTFGLIKIDHQQAVGMFSQSGKELTLMEIGQTIKL